MNKISRNTPQIPRSRPVLRRIAAAVLLCCAGVAALDPLPVLAQAAGQPSGQSASGAALSFVNADIESVIKAIGQFTGMTFIIDPRVKGTITLVSEKPLTKAQAFQLLTSALRLQGYAVVTGDGFAKVVPEAEAKLQSSPTQIGIKGAKARGDQIVTQVFRLGYESAANLTAVLRPLISPNNSIMADPGNNSLVITDYADNLRRLAKIIAALDSPPGADLDIIPIRYGIASDVATLVSRLMEPAPGGDSGRVSVVADPRTNSVVVRAPSAGRANIAKTIIAKLDQPTSEAGNIHVVYLKNADAARVAQTLRAVVSQDVSAVPVQQQGTSGGSIQAGIGAGQPGGGGGTLGGQQGQQSSTGMAGTGGTFAQQGQATATGAGGGQGSGFIQADALTNSLIITASDPVYRNLRNVIEQLDVRRAQVYLEALVVEVSSNKASDFGVQWVGATGNSTSDYRVGALQSFPAASSGNIVNLSAASRAGIANLNVNLVPSGFTIGLFRQENGQLTLGAVARALETTGNANILSTPNIITLDNELATIKVGQNVPIVTGSFTTSASGASNNPFQTIDRKDVGLVMKVRPQISEGGTVKMAIYHENSSVVPNTLNSASGVVTNVRAFESNVLADDGQIIVLGGLIEDTEGDNEDRVHGLADIPIIGNLFKYRSRTRNKTNLMVFLRPVVVRGKEDSNTLALDRYGYMRATGVAQQPEPSPLLKDLGAPVLPPLTDGQPSPGGIMAPVPPRPAGTPVPARAAPTGPQSPPAAPPNQR
jgi:general secretion pathway protein D